ncbi:MAG TPA: EVE domain-containing protein [Candidatus Limnocylindrales bacterium]|nr:EVE domain-containing protein [Candidatus Limnocylindrales bacterium]
MTGYWINTVSRDHVLLGMRGGFTQANHGRPHALRRLQKGDLIAFYSPRTSYPEGEPLRHFTAIARVLDDEPFQAEMTTDFHPWRRLVETIVSQEAPVAPLIRDLAFIRDKGRWGFVFRRGMFEIGEDDFRRIARAMDAAI